MDEKRCSNFCEGYCSPLISLFVLMFFWGTCVADDAPSAHSNLLPEDSGSRQFQVTSKISSIIASLPPMPGTNLPTPNRSDPPIDSAQLPKPKGVDWNGLYSQSMFFLGIEHGYRLGTQPGTRNALKGKFFDDWFTSVSATHGWGDGDDFLTNYIGHPMQGAVAANIFVQNDPRGRTREFSWESGYWNSRLKAMAWSAFYSTQFELGPISEASIGNVGYPGSSLSGAVDLVVTPLAGFGWQLGEDALDKYLIVRIENWTRNPVVLMLARSFLNPTRSFANAMRLRLPWNRDMRPGIWKDHSANR